MGTTGKDLRHSPQCSPIAWQLDGTSREGVPKSLSTTELWQLLLVGSALTAMMGWEPGCRTMAAEVRQCIEGTRGKMGQVQKGSPTPSTPWNRIQFRNTAHIEASSLQAAKIAQLGCSTQAEHSILGLRVFFLMKNLIQACVFQDKLNRGTA